jgi:hypothetical protein
MTGKSQEKKPSKSSATGAIEQVQKKLADLDAIILRPGNSDVQLVAIVW